MLRKISVGLVTIFAALLLISNGYAAIDSFYTTDASGSTTPKSTFSWDETPWLYIKLSDGIKHLTASWWNDPSGNSYDESIGSSQSTAHWLSLSDWDTVKSPGEWTVDGNIFYRDGRSESMSSNFTVNPEPVSSVLFLLGGGALLVRRLQKRK